MPAALLLTTCPHASSAALVPGTAASSVQRLAQDGHSSWQLLANTAPQESAPASSTCCTAGVRGSPSPGSAHTFPAQPPAAGGAACAATRPLAPLLTPSNAARADFLPCLHTRADLADAASQAGFVIICYPIWVSLASHFSGQSFEPIRGL